jgi:hypothetical protein
MMLRIRVRTTSPARRRRPSLLVERLEERALLAGNLLLTAQVPGESVYNLLQYTQQGTLVSSVSIPLPPGSTDYEDARGLSIDPSGNVNVYDGTFTPSLATFSPSGNSWSFQTLAGWTTVNNISYGEVAAYKGYVFASDMFTYGGEPNGIVRFGGGPATRFAQGTDFIQLALGQDGLIYGLSYSGAVQVFNPDTLTQVRSFTLTGGPDSDIRGIAVDGSGTIFAVTWSTADLVKYDANGNFVASLHLASDNLINIALDTDGQMAVGGRFGNVYLTSESLAPAQTIQTNQWVVFATFDHYIGTKVLPVANPGGPYTISEGGSLTLDGSGSSDADGDTLSYSWDVNGDGVFGDATGAGPTLTWAQLQALGIDDGPHTYKVQVKVDDGHGSVVTSAATTLTLGNTPPAAGISEPIDGYNGVQGQARTFTLTATDPSSGDTAAGFTYAVDWGDGQSTTTPTGQSGAGIQLSHAYAVAGSYTISVTATDKDGGQSAAVTTTENIQVAEQQGNNLVVGGTAGNDAFAFTPGTGGTLQVTVNKQSAGSFTPPGPVDVYGYAGTDNVTLNGTAGDDSFTVSGLTATLNGLTFVGTATEGWVLNGLGGSNTLTVLSTVKTAPVTFTGGSGSNTLHGPNASATWTITKANGGTLATTPATGAVSFSQVQHLVGGTADDTFKFKPLGTVQLLDAGGGTNWLDYSAFTTPVMVNLVTGSASNVTGAVSNIQNVRGGAGDDSLTGGGGNILVGGAGNDTLVDAYAGSAASGRSLLIGGAGGDTLTAGSAGDILISGTTSYDLNNAALLSVLAEWQSADDYTTRFNKLDGIQKGQKYLLVWGTKVQDDGTADTLNGSAAGLEWFFANQPQDTLNNLDQPGHEHVNNTP